MGLPERYPSILRILFDEMIEPDPAKRVSIHHVHSKLMTHKIYGAKMQMIYNESKVKNEKVIYVD